MIMRSRSLRVSVRVGGLTESSMRDRLVVVRELVLAEFCSGAGFLGNGCASVAISDITPFIIHNIPIALRISEKENTS